MFSLPYEKLELTEKTSGTPCFFDPKANDSLVRCYCNRPNELDHPTEKRMIKCFHCGKLSHTECNGLNIKMPQFMCAIC